MHVMWVVRIKVGRSGGSQKWTLPFQNLSVFSGATFHTNLEASPNFGFRSGGIETLASSFLGISLELVWLVIGAC